MSDLIRRSVLMEALEKEQKECELDMTSPNFFKAKMIVREQPTIEAVPVVYGEWIKNSPNIGVMEAFHRMGIGKEMSVNSIYWTCSVCGNWGTPNHKFCSNCGADMRKGGA